MKDIIERLENDDMFMDAIDDAIHEISDLRLLLTRAYPFTRGTIREDIQKYFEKVVENSTPPK